MGWNCVNNLSRKLYNNRDKSNLKITARFVVNDSTFDNFAKMESLNAVFLGFHHDKLQLYFVDMD